MVINVFVFSVLVLVQFLFHFWVIFFSLSLSCLLRRVEVLILAPYLSVLFLFVSLSQPTDFLTGGSFTINFMFSNLVSCLLRRVEVLILAPFLSVLFLFVSLSQPTDLLTGGSFTINFMFSNLVNHNSHLKLP